MGPDFAGRENIYIDSVQILPDFRFTTLFPRLCVFAIQHLVGKPGAKVLTDVQVSNPQMLRRLQKIGFTFSDDHSTKTRKMVISNDKLQRYFQLLRRRYVDYFLDDYRRDF